MFKFQHLFYYYFVLKFSSLINIKRIYQLFCCLVKKTLKDFRRKMKLVSIITPLYNREDTFFEFLRSVLNQTYSNWELIIVDDCSTDNSYKLALQSSFQDNRIKVFRNKNNQGAALTRNFAITQAEGEYIAFLDSDDLWEPLKLEKQVEFMEVNNYAFSYTSYFQGNDKKIVITGPKKINKYMMKASCWVGCLTVMYNAKLLGKFYAPDIKRRNDYAMWLLVIRFSDCYYLDMPLATYRISQNSISKVNLFRKFNSNRILYKTTYNYGSLFSFFFSVRNIVWTIIRRVFYKKKYFSK